MRKARHIGRIDALAKRLATISFDARVWDDTLEELRLILRADGAIAYRVSRSESGWAFDFLRRALAPDPRVHEIFDSFVRSVIATSKPWPAYNPARPAVWQRNRAIAERELSRSAGRTNRLGDLHRAMGSPWRNPDQVRVLVCDGPRLLAWVGTVRRRALARGATALLQRLVPALHSRLVFEDLVRERDLSRAAFEAALDAINAPSLLLDRHGRILRMNEPARLLEKARAEVLAAALRAREQPDPRCEVRLVSARGIPPALLVTIRSAEAESDERIPSGRRWDLTPRQQGVLDLAVAGLSNKQIGADLGISEGTVELHMTAIFKKARADSRAALIAKYWSEAASIRRR